MCSFPRRVTVATGAAVVYPIAAIMEDDWYSGHDAGGDVGGARGSGGGAMGGGAVGGYGESFTPPNSQGRAGTIAGKVCVPSS